MGLDPESACAKERGQGGHAAAAGCGSTERACGTVVIVNGGKREREREREERMHVFDPFIYTINEHTLQIGCTSQRKKGEKNPFAPPHPSHGTESEDDTVVFISNLIIGAPSRPKTSKQAKK